MSTSARVYADPFQFERDQLLALAERTHQDYVSAEPFPHAVIDDFLPEEVLDEVLGEFPEPREVDWHKFDSGLERKLASKDDASMGAATRHLLAELNSAAFLDFLEALTGIEGLIADPHFEGGGLHQIERGGHLKVHADFNRHPHTQLDRRLNVLLYLNREWQPEYGGALELWNRDMSRSEAQILPHFNRCVVFSTTSTSFHGHPEPLNCPESRTRKSLALYYYTKDRPASERRDEHNTLFQARPGEEFGDGPGSSGRTFKDRAKAGLRQVAPPILYEAVKRRRARRG